MAFESISNLSISWDQQVTDGDNSSRYVQDRNAVGFPLPVSIKDTESETHKIFHERRTLSAEAYTYDLAGGVTSPLTGETLTFTKIKLLFLYNLTTANDSIIAVGAGSNPFASWLGASGDVVNLHPSGLLFIQSPILGYTVTAGTGDVLTLTTAADAQYDIVIIGTV